MRQISAAPEMSECTAGEARDEQIAASAQAQARRFEEIIRADPDLMRLLAAIRGLRLPQWRLVAGCPCGMF